MSGVSAGRIGSSISWQAVQHFGVKAIYLIRVIILARLLVPDDFGLLAIAAVSLGFLVQVTEFGMVPALIQRSKVTERHYDAAWTVGMIRALAVSTVVILAAPLIAGLFAEPRATGVIRLLGVRPLLQAAASVKVAELTRNLEFRGVALLQLLEAVATTVVSIALADRFGVWALVYGSLAGPALYAALSYVVASHRPRLVFERETIGPLIRFGRWIFVSSLIAVAGRSVLHLVISRRLGVADLGLYFLAAKLAFLPSGAASDVIGSVAFSVYSRLQSDRGKAVRAFQTQLLAMSACLFPVYALILVVAPTLTEQVLGPRWVGSAPVIQVLAIVSLLGLLGDAAVPVLKGFGRPAQVTLLEAVQTVLLAGLVWELAGRFGLAGAAAAWLPAILASQVLAAVFLRQALGHPFTGLLRRLLAITAIAALGALVAGTIGRTIPGLAGLVVAAAAAGLLVGLLLLVGDRRLDLGLGREATRLFPRLGAMLGYPIAPGKSQENS